MLERVYLSLTVKPDNILINPFFLHLSNLGWRGGCRVHLGQVTNPLLDSDNIMQFYKKKNPTHFEIINCLITVI